MLNATGSLQLENQIFTYSGDVWESDLPIAWTDLSGTTDIVALYPTYKDNLYDDLYPGGRLEDVLYIKDRFEAGRGIGFQFKHLFSRLTFHISEELQGEIKEIRLTTPVIVDKIIPATADLKLDAYDHHPRRCFRKLFIYHSSEREYRFEGRDYHQSCELCQRIEPTRFLKQLRIYMQYQDS